MTCTLLTVRFICCILNSAVSSDCLTAITQRDTNDARQKITPLRVNSVAWLDSCWKQFSKRLRERNMTQVSRRTISQSVTLAARKLLHAGDSSSRVPSPEPSWQCWTTLRTNTPLFMCDTRNIPSSPNTLPAGTLGQSNNCEWDPSLTSGWLLLVLHTLELGAKALWKLLVDHYLKIGWND